MKLLTKTILCITVLLSTSNIYSQFSLGGQYSNLSWSDVDLSNHGFGLVGGYYFKDRMDVNVAANFYSKTDTTIIGVNYEVSVFLIDASLNYYLLGRPQETNAGFYGIAGLSFANVKQTIDFAGVPLEGEEAGLQTYFNIGAGVCWKYLFLNWKINLAPNEVNGQAVTASFSNFSTLNIGAKFDLGKGGSKSSYGRKRYKKKKRYRR